MVGVGTASRKRLGGDRCVLFAFDGRWIDLVASRVRGEFRDALVWLGNPKAAEGADRMYVTRSWRATVGVRAVLTDRITIKAEYLRNGEYGGIPAIDNDVFSSSLVMIF